MRTKEEILEMLLTLETNKEELKPVFNLSYVEGAFEALNWVRGRGWRLEVLLKALEDER